MEPVWQLLITVVAAVLAGIFGMVIKKTEGRSQIQTTAQASVIEHATEIFEAAMKELRARNIELEVEVRDLRKALEERDANKSKG